MLSRFVKFIAVLAALCLVCGLFVFAVPTAVAEAEDDELSAAGCNYPSTLSEGKSYTLNGVISSEKTKIAKLVVGVFSSGGKMLTGRSWNPNAKAVDIRVHVNSHVKFGSLKAGTYTYKITATNGSVQKTLLSEQFVVTPKEPEPDELSATGCNYPTSLEKGHGFPIKGIVRSQTSKLSRLSVGVYDDDDKMLTGRSWNPNSKAVDLRHYVNPFVKFGKLAVGVYTYKITATNASGKETLLSEDFEVTAPEPVPDKLTASGCNYPTSLVKGHGFSLKGVVWSQSSKITKLSAGVYDEDDKMLTGRSWNPNAKTVDLRWYVNPFVKFGKLAVGTYTYKITATNAAGKETLLSEVFEVTAPKPVSDKLSASGLNAPKILNEGRGFSLRGVVSSQTSKISKLTVGVYDEDNKMVTGRSWNPKAKVVDFRWYVNPFVKFGKLDIGVYTYRVTATNAAGTSTLLEATFEVVE